MPTACFAVAFIIYFCLEVRAKKKSIKQRQKFDKNELIETSSNIETTGPIKKGAKLLFSTKTLIFYSKKPVKMATRANPIEYKALLVNILFKF